MSKRVALVLGSGGARGAFHIILIIAYNILTFFIYTYGIEIAYFIV